MRQKTRRWERLGTTIERLAKGNPQLAAILGDLLGTKDYDAGSAPPNRGSLK
jgi:hypothetical protein